MERITVERYFIGNTRGIAQSVRTNGNWFASSRVIGNSTIWKRNGQKLTISPLSIHRNLKNLLDFTETGRIAVLSTRGINSKNTVDSVATNANLFGRGSVPAHHPKKVNHTPTSSNRQVSVPLLYPPLHSTHPFPHQSRT